MPKKTDIANSLLKHNYFPVQKRNREELSPLFTSITFDESIALLLSKNKARIGGYDQVEYLSTRFNNLPRPLSIPHPQPYSLLSLELKDCWDKIKLIAENKSSIIKPRKHPDGRLLIMDYDQSRKSSHRHLHKSQGKKYVAHTDIANFFNSIYTHAIPWALVGFDEAKKNKTDHSQWYNKLDKYQRLCKRDETMGIPIGPATSNIVAECILSKIDDKLLSEGYVFSRFIDDYTAYCSTHEHAEKFISDLSRLLKEYKLSLNLKKTFIYELPSSSSSDWVSDLSTRLPKTRKVRYADAIRFIDYAVHIQRKTPDGSILKYAVKTMVSKVNLEAKYSVAIYALNLAYQYPIIIPILDSLLLGLSKLSGFNLEEKLVSILTENLRNNRSDGICWCLFLINKYCSATVEDSIAVKIIDTEDCLSIVSLYSIGGHERKIIHFANHIMSRDLFSIDEQWILLYQLFYDNKINNPYENEFLYSDVKTSKESNVDAMRREITCFNILKKEKVSFLNRGSLSISKFDSLKAMLFNSYYSRIRTKVAY